MAESGENGTGGRVAVVTGGSRGIGFAICRRLVADGYRVCVTGRKEDSLAAAVEALGGSEFAIGVPGKAHDFDHQDAAVRATMETFGRWDVLVNNVATNPVYGPVLSIEPAAVAKIFEVNVLAALSWTRKAWDAWQGEHGGAVVNIASVAGLAHAEGIGVYGASKAAMIQLTRQLAVELAPGVRVNAVAPAVVKTDFAKALYAGGDGADGENADGEETAAKSYPLRRLGVPDDIAGAVSMLASADAAWITGQVLTIDGGLTVAGGI